jgi:hypothetical protein
MLHKRAPLDFLPLRERTAAAWRQGASVKEARFLLAVYP